MFRTFACTAFAALLVVTPQAQTGTTIRIWKVGSPHTGDTPDTEMPPALAREAGSRGWRLSIDAFPAQAFADRFFAAEQERIRSRRPGVRQLRHHRRYRHKTGHASSGSAKIPSSATSSSR